MAPSHTTRNARFLIAALILIILSLVPVAAFPWAPQAEAAAGYRAGPDGKIIGPDGRPFFILGVNYEGPSDRAWNMWPDDKWNPSLIEADLARLSKAGINTIRAFVQRPLATDVDAGRFSKLDTFLDLLAKHRLAVVLTLYDYGEEDLAKASATAARIAERYRDRPTILAYDLKNEPKYANLVLSKYPVGSNPPLLATNLGSIYGEKLPMSEVGAWRDGDGKAMSPTRFSDEEVYRTANNYRIYREFLSASAVWVSGRDNVSTMDYMDSADSAKWRPLLDAMSATLGAWLAPQVAAIKKADPERFVTVGYNDPILAKLGANEALSFHSMHRYVGTSVKSIDGIVTIMENQKRSFGNKPVALTEFGWSNATIDVNDSAILETAMWLRLYNAGLAGGIKWMLDDLPEVGNPKEDNFGMFRRDGSAKPVVAATTSLASYFNRSSGQGQLQIEPDGEGLKFRFADKDAVFLGGRDVAEKGLTVKPSSAALVMLQWDGALRFVVTAKTDLDVNVNALTGRPIGGNATLQRGEAPSPAKIEGERIVVSAEPGSEYRLKSPLSAVDARIQIVWPQGNAPVAQATKANIAAVLFDRGTKQAACPPANAPVRLWRSVDNGVEEPVAAGERKNEKSGALTFPSWNFNDVDVSAARNPASKIFFRVSVDGFPSYGSIWSHGADARTIFPKPDVPSEVVGAITAADAKIEIVWPHANKPVTEADKANIAAYVFQRGTLQSVNADWQGTVRLWRSVNAGVFESVAVGVRTIKRDGPAPFPVWSFNDVDVSAAKNPANKVYFRVSVDGVDSRSNVWSHASDARTYFPDRDIPTGVVNCS